MQSSHSWHPSDVSMFDKKRINSPKFTKKEEKKRMEEVLYQVKKRHVEYKPYANGKKKGCNSCFGTETFSLEIEKTKQVNLIQSSHCLIVMLIYPDSICLSFYV